VRRAKTAFIDYSKFAHSLSVAEGLHFESTITPRETVADLKVESYGLFASPRTRASDLTVRDLTGRENLYGRQDTISKSGTVCLAIAVREQKFCVAPTARMDEFYLKS
jgi:hypothetical protein